MCRLLSAFLRDSRGSGGTSTRVTIRGLPSFAFCYVHFCSCARSCSELRLVNLCSCRALVIHRCWDPALFVVASVFSGGRRNFLHAHQCTCRCHHSFMPAGSCQALVLGLQSGVSIPGFGVPFVFTGECNNYYAHAPGIPLMSVFLHVCSVSCNTCTGASILGLRSPTLGCVHRATAPVHALTSYR